MIIQEPCASIQQIVIFGVGLIYVSYHISRLLKQILSKPTYDNHIKGGDDVK